MSEQFVKAMKHDHMAFMKSPMCRQPMHLAFTFEKLDERYPHNALKLGPLREFRAGSRLGNLTM
ncbi:MULTISPECIES: hypothetical protein [unclassified Herbaspirillum]|uniref:hypothetical protein n=1 Tax=unclassified Herbaspirillum TaxID=2624150 RepID=UPI000C0A073F|nr:MULTISPECIES: hypothetical protein [unclassified Herbaspirillum]MAF02805.1 hypothetical protein [Herbaspirillum sp.]MBO15706.1 hypothetical protein [Herbaspirillum sp.]|tara:strand:+ start:3815 stop:4006 length:192 start_codon:yes stop_codon:yes gene_type:complete